MMKDKWAYFAGMFGFIGNLEYWRINEATSSYTYKYCDECGEKQCVKVDCQASRECGLYGWMDEAELFYKN